MTLNFSDVIKKINISKKKKNHAANIKFSAKRCGCLATWRPGRKQAKNSAVYIAICRISLTLWAVWICNLYTSLIASWWVPKRVVSPWCCVVFILLFHQNVWFNVTKYNKSCLVDFRNNKSNFYIRLCIYWLWMAF